MKLQLSQTKLIILTAIFLVVADNYDFFSHVLVAYPANGQNIIFLLSIAVVFCCVTIILFTLFSSRLTTKPILIFALFTAAAISYFANTYHVIMDDKMIQNVVETNVAESLDLLSVKMLIYLTTLGLIPALLVWKIKLTRTTLKKALLHKITTIILCMVIIVVALLAGNRFYASFFREHKPLRYRANPLYSFYSAGEYVAGRFFATTTKFKQIGLDAHVAGQHSRPKLAIMVVGEAARADHFSLNGYQRDTNPLLKTLDIINLPDVASCGTSTAVSVPCMFSILDRRHYSDSKARSTENVLDILKRSGVEILWRDNNSSSKGVAKRVTYQNYRTSANNTICTREGECRDVGMLVGLQQFIDSHKDKDILIILHQMGNHGPAYYKRYPQEFAKFLPVCTSNQLEQCSEAQINNAYDNAIRYTDHFLAKTIDLLKHNNGRFQTSMIYMSDHGESLGENGLYLHGLPYAIAPEAQTHIAALMWFGNTPGNRQTIEYLKRNASRHYSQDNLFHTLLGLFDIQTSVYDKKLDMLEPQN